MALSRVQFRTGPSGFSGPGPWTGGLAPSDWRSEGVVAQWCSGRGPPGRGSRAGLKAQVGRPFALSSDVGQPGITSLGIVVVEQGQHRLALIGVAVPLDRAFSLAVCGNRALKPARVACHGRSWKPPGGHWDEGGCGHGGRVAGSHRRLRWSPPRGALSASSC